MVCWVVIPDVVLEDKTDLERTVEQEENEEYKKDAVAIQTDVS